MTRDANYYAIDPEDTHPFYGCTAHISESYGGSCGAPNARILTPNEGCAVCPDHADRLAYTDHN